MEQETVVLVLSVLLAISEGLALIPALQSNSVLQLAVNIVKALVGVFKKQ